MRRQNARLLIWLCASLLIIGVLVFPAINSAVAQGPCRGAWAEGNTYNLGYSVTFNGNVYTALVTHTAYVGTGWNPVAAPSLWRTGGSCTGGPQPTPTPTPNPTPTPTPTPNPTPTPTPTPN